MLGIVIANWNGEKLIGKTLKSLCNQQYHDFKVYIIDNNSKDKSEEVIECYKEKLNIHLVKLNYNSGFAVANNIGIEEAISDGCNYILTLNNDIEMQDQALINAMAEVNKKEADMYQLLMINYYDRKKCDSAGLRFNKQLIPIQVGYKLDIDEVMNFRDKIEGVCAGAAIFSVAALKAGKLENGDYFDSKFFAYYEDVDLSLRLRSLGYKAKLISDSIVFHMHSATGERVNGLKEYYLIRNLFLYTKRNQSEEELRKNRLCYYGIFTKKFIKSLFNVKVMKFTVRGLKDGLKERKRL